MRFQLLVGLSCVGVLGLVACGPNRAPPADLPGDGGEGGRVAPATGGVFATGGAAGASGRAIGHAGSAFGQAGDATAGASGAGGAGAAGGSGTGGPLTRGGAGGSSCGNGSIEGGEPCDGDLLNDETCKSMGFDEGDLVCVDCEFDTSGCSGTENCYDARDNDGDADVDCDDSECAAACSSLCAFAPTLDDPSTVQGDTTGHTSATSASCRGDEGAGGAGSVLSGNEVAYRFVPAQTGLLDARLVSEVAELTVSVRASCESGPELACALGRSVVAPVSEGEPVYVVVDGVTLDDVGAFELSVATRAVICGDGVIDPGEECDDGGVSSGGGCDESCQVESTEVNPQGNDTPPHADDYVEPFYGTISPDDPIDYVRFDVAGSGTLRVRILDLGNDACVNGELDSTLEILESDGETILAENDDFGGTLCSEVADIDVSAGTYYVRVSAAGEGNTPEFPYRLEVLVE